MNGHDERLGRAGEAYKNKVKTSSPFRLTAKSKPNPSSAYAPDKSTIRLQALERSPATEIAHDPQNKRAGIGDGVIPNLKNIILGAGGLVTCLMAAGIIKNALNSAKNRFYHSVTRPKEIKEAIKLSEKNGIPNEFWFSAKVYFYEARKELQFGLQKLENASSFRNMDLNELREIYKNTFVAAKALNKDFSREVQPSQLENQFEINYFDRLKFMSMNHKNNIFLDELISAYDEMSKFAHSLSSEGGWFDENSQITDAYAFNQKADANMRAATMSVEKIVPDLEHASQFLKAAL